MFHGWDRVSHIWDMVSHGWDRLLPGKGERRKGGREIWRSISAGTRLSLDDSPCRGRTWKRDFRTGCLLRYSMVVGDGFAARMSLTWSSGDSARRKLGRNEAPPESGSGLAGLEVDPAEREGAAEGITVSRRSR